MRKEGEGKSVLALAPAAPSTTCVILVKASGLSMHHRLLKKCRGCQCLFSQAHHAGRIVWGSPGRYYLCLSLSVSLSRLMPGTDRLALL